MRSNFASWVYQSKGFLRYQIDMQYFFIILQVTPGIGVLCVLLIIFVARDPPRGMAENSVNTQSQSSVKEDMLSLLKKYVISFSENMIL